MSFQEVSQWTYIGEGSKNIVFRYIGNDEMYIGWALRCTKLEIIVEDTVKIFKYDILNEIGMPLDTNKYLEEIVKPIVPLSSEYLPFAKPISKYTKESINVINTTLTNVYLVKDNTCLVIPNQLKSKSITPQITFEIKPKSCDNFPNTDLCQFCSFQYYKFSKNKEKELSKYCPALLFSNEKENIIKAFNFLFETPQNNLSVFVDNKITDLLTVKNINKMDKEISIDDLIQIYTLILLKTNVLSCIYTLQNRNKLSLEELSNIINKKSEDKSENRFSKDEVKILKDFVVSKSAKDCTIMITIQIFKDDADFKDDIHILKYKCYKVKYKVGIVDLDLKSPELIPLYIKMYGKTSKSLIDFNYLKKICYKKELNL